MTTKNKRTTGAKEVSLTNKELKRFLKDNPKWSVNANQDQIKREVKLGNYIDALTLLARIVVHAELLSHHPDITLSYQKMVIKLSTHSLKGLSQLDTDLAVRIEKIISHRL